MVQLLLRSDAGNRVDAALVRQEQAERDYWCSVLERVAETIRHLAVRGLAFRGTNEIIGSVDNGNFLGTYELKASKYFSVSVDSTPDISHVDQLTCILRYVLPSGPVERFVAFLDMQGHTGKVLAGGLLGFLTRHEVNIADCRGQII